MKKCFIGILFIFISITLSYSQQQKSRTNEQINHEWVLLKNWTLTTKYNNEYQICSGCANLYYIVYRTRYKIDTEQVNEFGNPIYNYKYVFYFISASYWPNGRPANTEIHNIQFYYKNADLLYHRWSIVGQTSDTMVHFSFWFNNPNAIDFITFYIEKININ
jgi:hypothetical protein